MDGDSDLLRRFAHLGRTRHLMTEAPICAIHAERILARRTAFRRKALYGLVAFAASAVIIELLMDHSGQEWPSVVVEVSPSVRLIPALAIPICVFWFTFIWTAAYYSKSKGYSAKLAFLLLIPALGLAAIIFWPAKPLSISELPTAE